MKNIKLFSLAILALGLLASCSSVRVVADYDQKVDFQTYDTFAFYKTGIDRAQISDLDKKRILRAIDAEMSARGFTKSQEPDLLVSIFTKESRMNMLTNYRGNIGIYLILYTTLSVVW